jgi:hypothetical protein
MRNLPYSDMKFSKSPYVPVPVVIAVIKMALEKAAFNLIPRARILTEFLLGLF